MKHVLLVLTLLGVSACGFQTVNEGNRGIETKFGKMIGEPLSPGLHFYNPFTSDIFEMPVREEALKSSTSCFTKDTQNVVIEFTVTYYPDPSKIGQLYTQFGITWSDKVVLPAILGSLKDSVGQYIADDLVSKREHAKQSAELEIKEALKDRGIFVTRLDFTNLDFDTAYEQAVESKVVAIQKASEAKNKTVQVLEEAKQTIESAKAEAESMKIKTQALSQNKSLVQYEAVQKWDGALPQIILGDKSMPILDLKTLGGKE